MDILVSIFDCFCLHKSNCSFNISAVVMIVQVEIGQLNIYTKSILCDHAFKRGIFLF